MERQCSVMGSVNTQDLCPQHRIRFIMDALHTAETYENPSRRWMWKQFLTQISSAVSSCSSNSELSLWNPNTMNVMSIFRFLDIPTFSIINILIGPRISPWKSFCFFFLLRNVVYFNGIDHSCQKSIHIYFWFVLKNSIFSKNLFIAYIVPLTQKYFLFKYFVAHFCLPHLIDIPVP